MTCKELTYIEIEWTILMDQKIERKNKSIFLSQFLQIVIPRL